MYAFTASKNHSSAKKKKKNWNRTHEVQPHAEFALLQHTQRHKYDTPTQKSAKKQQAVTHYFEFKCKDRFMSILK